MLEIVKYKDWVIEVDRLQTLQAYQNIEEGRASICKCSDCENYAQNREMYFPEEVKLLFRNLGIDLMKEADATRNKKLENGLHAYTGWFHFIGIMVHGKNCRVKTNASGGFKDELLKIEDNFEMGFCKGWGRIESAFKEEVRSELIMLHFSTSIPWVIDKETVFPI
jgi:hypothetical protein